METGEKYKVTFKNHVQNGILHGEIIEITTDYIKLLQFTNDNIIFTIKRKNITKFERIEI